MSLVLIPASCLSLVTKLWCTAAGATDAGEDGRDQRRRRQRQRAAVSRQVIEGKSKLLTHKKERVAQDDDSPGLELTAVPGNWFLVGFGWRADGERMDRWVHSTH